MKWISVYDDLPKRGEWVLVLCPDWCEAELDIAQINWAGNWSNTAEQQMNTFPTHWAKVIKPKKK